MFYDKKELQSGIKHEMEHTGDKALATKIAIDHLIEDPRYYTKLNKSGLKEESHCEGAMTPLEAGMGECDYMDVAPNVAVIKIGYADDNGQTKLTSSGLGKSGSPKPLKSDNLDAPAEKAKVGANKVVVSKTPAITSAADPLDHYFGAAMEEGKNWPYDDEGKLEPEPKAKGDYRYKDEKFAKMGGTDNPTGDFGDFDEKPKHGGSKKIKPSGSERGGPDDPDIDTPHMGR
jgi:hypothetical protein